MSEVKTACPTCGSDRVVPIGYGFPSADMTMNADDGKIELGGCCVTDDDPQWLCRVCGTRWL